MTLLPPRLAPVTESSPAPGDPPVCSARGCRTPAVWALRWNNPRLHDPERRKTWLACAEHRGTLGDFLTARSFLREVEPLPGSLRSTGE
ncbi:hypothetical protein GA0070618_4132 [Micromonospora echinospora]|uniref:Acetone carboxylase n=1 Tax=Micromonospora echinospora TaxID=1877 RepID=A0A1C4YM15_MICEC|nr:hypothetical protein GA0070618_4132 [Micromonospora echinospora]